MRVRMSLALRVEETGQAVFFERAGSPPDMNTDGFTAATADTFLLPDTTQPIALSFGNLASAAGLFLEADGVTALTLNGATLPLVLTPASGATHARILLEAPISSLKVASGQPGTFVRGRYVMWGSDS